MQQRDGWRIARPVALLAICSLGALLTLVASDRESQSQAPAAAVAVEGEAAGAGSLDDVAFGEEW